MSMRSHWKQQVSSKQEDEALVEIMTQRDIQKWNNVSLVMKTEYGILSKSGKQCRERWLNHLSPRADKSQWSAEEDHILFFYQHIFGNKWTYITKQLSNRSENCVKNRFYCQIRKKLKKYNKLHPHSVINLDIKELVRNQKLVEMLVELDHTPHSIKLEDRKSNLVPNNYALKGCGGSNGVDSNLEAPILDLLKIDEDRQTCPGLGIKEDRPPKELI